MVHARTRTISAFFLVVLVYYTSLYSSRARTTHLQSEMSDDGSEESQNEFSYEELKALGIPLPNVMLDECEKLC